MCKACILKEHTKNPLHVIEEWTSPSGSWRRTTLYKLGMVIRLGHNGRYCSNSRPKRSITIVHKHGIDTACVEYCGCLAPKDIVRVPDATQLLEAGFWPASWMQPRMAFTLHVMKEFQRLANTAGINARDYLATLAAKTDNVNPDSTTDRYRKFLASTREYATYKQKGV